MRRDQGDLPAAFMAYEESLAIRRELAARDPGNAVWASDVSASLDRIGDVHHDQGDLPAAFTAYGESRAIRRELAVRDPGNAVWARNVSVSLIRVGNVHLAQGDLPAAFITYEESLAILRELAARDPGNAAWARDVWVSLWPMATADSENAATHWSEIVERMEDMEARGVLLPIDVRLLETARQNLDAVRN